jgi:hypothetical protein
MRHSLPLVLCLNLFVVASAGSTLGQEFPTPGPEHAQLKKMEGTWDAAISMPEGGDSSKGEMTCKMECGGMWLASDFKGDFGGFQFSGKGLDGYDAKSKKYVAVWVDSMSGRPMNLEGTFDEATSTLTMTGEGPGMDGQPTKFKNVTKFESEDEHVFKMYEVKNGDEKLMMTIAYKRKK